MRRIYRTIVAIAVVTVAVSSCSERLQEAAQTGTVRTQAPDNHLQTIMDRGVLRVGTTGDARSEERRGFEIELTTKLAADMGVGVEHVPTDEPNLVSGLVSGRYDIAPGVWDPVRARSASYTRPVVATGSHDGHYIGILVQQGHHELRSFIDSWINAQELSGAIDELAAQWGLSD